MSKPFWRKVNKGIYVSPCALYLATKNEEFLSGFRVEEFNLEALEFQPLWEDVSLKQAKTWIEEEG